MQSFDGWRCVPWVKRRLAALEQCKVRIMQYSPLGDSARICGGSQGKCRRLVRKNGCDSSFVSHRRPRNTNSADSHFSLEDLAKLSEDGQQVQALQGVELPIQRGSPLSTGFFYNLILGCISKRDVTAGRTVHRLIIRTGLGSNSFLGSHLIRMFASFGLLLEANHIFSELPEPNMFAWSVIIFAHVKHGDSEQAIKLYHQMQQSELKPNEYIFVAVLKACGSVGALTQGKAIHAQVVGSGLDSEMFVGSTVVDMYAKCGSLEDMHIAFEGLLKRDIVTWNAIISGFAQHGLSQEAFMLLRRMQREGIKRNVVTWNVIITGFAQHGNGHDALRLFQRMQEEGMQPNSITFVSILNACSGVSALDQGKFIHADIVKHYDELDMHVGNALIDLYAKCGSLENARLVFHKLSKRDVVTWNAMMAGYALHSHYRLTLQCFEGMQQDGLKPNDVSFVCLLSACNRMGLVEEGFHHFKSMIRDHSLKPKIDHYTCMVDLLGRMGYLKDARDLLQSMPFEPDLVAWKALLYNCNIYGNIKLGTRSFDSVVTGDSAGASAYVLMSNMYANAEMWQDADKIQELRKCACAWKKPGYAFIEVDSKVHNFTVGDQDHSQNDQVCVKLKRLSEQVQHNGYIPHLDSLPHLISAESMEGEVCALFGLTCTP